ncbi:hypothetical protein C2G38_2194938 [Gigaspora rosea]|uniref:Uncharacterized protein n=1 Tax=Gigaspora rosea TaxID=44941 RepID=A0A397UY42_9GLOM|nr:hypothetical protein C2G38_2194938 [Gigaspora rosea]
MHRLDPLEQVKVLSNEQAKTVNEGKGHPFGQIPSVARAIDKHKMSDETGSEREECVGQSLFKNKEN